MLEGMEGVVCHMDDILVHGTDQTQHDARVRAVLQRLQAAGLTLNNKCEFSKTSIKFLGHIIDASGILADSSKMAAIVHFPVERHSMVMGSITRNCLLASERHACVTRDTCPL